MSVGKTRDKWDQKNPRFGVFLPARYKRYIYEQAEKSYRTAPKYIEMLIQEDMKKKRAEKEATNV